MTTKTTTFISFLVLLIAIPFSNSFTVPLSINHHRIVDPIGSSSSIAKKNNNALLLSSSSRVYISNKIQQKPLAASADAVADGDGEGGSVSGGDATIPQEIFNLVKGIVGAGVLSLPAGIAAFANNKSAITPAVALITIIGMLSGYGFFLIGRVCSITKTESFRDAWSKSVSEKTSWIPALSVTCKTLCAVLAYSMILGDTFTSLLATVGITSFSTTTVLLGITACLLLPLCLLKNLSSLAPFSLVGVMGMIYTAVAMTIRFVGKSYLPGTGKFSLNTPTHYQPSFGTVGASGVLTPKAAILVSMLSTAYMAHFNAPKFYTELKNNTIQRFLKVVGTSFGISIALFATMASIGFATFGGNCSGLILNNYANTDTLMNFSRIAVAISLVFSYPLAFVGARDGFIDLFKLDGIKKSTTKTNLLTVGLLSAITGAALIIPDVTFVLSFAGATLGNALIYVYPAIMFRGAIKQLKDKATKNMKREVKFSIFSALLGIGMGVLGAKMAIQSL